MTSNDDYRSKIRYNFSILCDYNKLITKNTWRAKAYELAIQVIDSDASPVRIETIEHVHGWKLSKSMMDKAEWIVRHGQNLPEVDTVIMTGDLEAIRNLASIHNIGASKAVDLVTNQHIRTIDQLENNTHLLNDLQKNGLLFHHHIIQRIPRDEMNHHSAFIENHINELCQKKKFQVDVAITGSYRRCESTSGDIDVLVCPRGHAPLNSCKVIIDEFRKIEYVPENGIFALGKKKFMGMCKLPEANVYRRLDLIITTPDELPFMLLYFTGNGEFNVKMRELAKKQGYLLNERGLHANKHKVDHIFQSEEDIFTFLGLRYVPPNERVPEQLIFNDS